MTGLRAPDSDTRTHSGQTGAGDRGRECEGSSVRWGAHSLIINIAKEKWKSSVISGMSLSSETQFNCRYFKFSHCKSLSVASLVNVSNRLSRTNIWSRRELSVVNFTWDVNCDGEMNSGLVAACHRYHSPHVNVDWGWSSYLLPEPGARREPAAQSCGYKVIIRNPNQTET